MALTGYSMKFSRPFFEPEALGTLDEETLASQVCRAMDAVRRDQAFLLEDRLPNAIIYEHWVEEN
jgi:hypothetical protein